MMSIEDMLINAQATRRAQGLHIRITGPEFDPVTYPKGFNAYAKDMTQRDKWIASELAKGNSVEIVE